MTKKCLVLLWLVIGLTFLAGCSARLSRLEADYGTSHALAKQNQTLNLEAGKRLEPVNGLNGQAAQSAVEKYRKGFENRTSASAKPLNISTDK